MEEIHFATSAALMRWVRLAVKLPRYDRVPADRRVVWKYGNGDRVEKETGKRGGTLNSNLNFLLRTGTGELEHSSEARMVSDIDSKGGVTLTINWDDA